MNWNWKIFSDLFHFIFINMQKMFEKLSSYYTLNIDLKFFEFNLSYY